MSDCVEATCTACDGRNQLTAGQMEVLGKSEPVECSQCGVLVKIKADAESELKAKVSVLILTIGAATVGVVALINIFGDAGFPTYFVAIPFILISAIMSSALSGSAIQLQSVDASG